MLVDGWSLAWLAAWLLARSDGWVACLPASPAGRLVACWIDDSLGWLAACLLAWFEELRHRVHDDDDDADSGRGTVVSSVDDDDNDGDERRGQDGFPAFFS